MEINPLSGRRTLVDRVVDQVCSNIESGAIRPGEHLPTEFELGNRFDVSRTVIREAIRRLQSLGLVEVRRGHGLFVGSHDVVRDSVRLLSSALSVSLADFEQFTDFRTAIECHAARHAALKATTFDVEKLQTLCDALVEAVEKGGNFEEVQERDVAFHLKIAAMSGNDLVRQILQLVRDMVMKSIARTVQGQFELLNAAETRALHQAIVDAIRNRDAVAAGKAMHEHMAAVLQRLQQINGATNSSLEAVPS
jgi:GntR family transcriptional regulator, transcriptional repressor for pyruvate dehydrogenase complex